MRPDYNGEFAGVENLGINRDEQAKALRELVQKQHGFGLG